MSQIYNPYDSLDIEAKALNKKNIYSNFKQNALCKSLQNETIEIKFILSIISKTFKYIGTSGEG